MILGIVGAGADKFTPELETKARERIRTLIRAHGATKVCSGESPVGGIDIYAKEEAIALLGPDGYIACPPTVHNWSGKGGYKDRNLEIADRSDAVVSLVVRTVPRGYTGMRFSECYHCGTNEHVKSGGCWTAKQARLKGKAGWTEVIE